MDAVGAGRGYPSLLVFCFVCGVSRTSHVQTEKTVRGEVGLGMGLGAGAWWAKCLER